MLSTQALWLQGDRSDPMSLKSQIMLQIGAWGKTGINCFVLITGYFMCKSHITLAKFLKMFLQVLFYHFLFGVLFMIFGYTPVSASSILGLLIPLRNIGRGFTFAFLLFYLCIPFLNVLIHHLDEKMHLRLIVLSFFIYVIPAFLPKFSVTFNYVSWFAVLYFVSSFVRLYPKKFFNKNKIWGIAMCCSILLSAVSVVAFSWYSAKAGAFDPYHFVSDSNNFLPFVTGLSSFMFFKNLQIRKNKFINAVSATTFGVLLIHANSDAMRQWLWKDALNNVYAFSQPWVFLHTVGSVLGIFVICSLIDGIRIRWIEKPVMNFLNRRLPALKARFAKFENTVLEKFDRT